MNGHGDNGAQCPVFRPTREEFEVPFCEYVRKIFRKYPDLPMFKVVPPKGWRPRRAPFPDLRKVQINVPIRQHVFGTKGAYRCLFVEQKPMSVADFKLAADEEAHRLAAGRGGHGHAGADGASAAGGEGRRASSRSTSSRHYRPPVEHEGHHSHQRTSAAADVEAAAADGTAAGGSGRAATAAAVTVATPAVDPDAVDGDMERAFWANVTLNPPMYGADTPTSFFDEKLPYGWNLNHLGDLLQSHPKVDAVPGVTTPMTYFGMWRSFFGWHKEDADLYSVNFLHWGAPKVWYGVPPSAKQKFERMAQSLFPELHRSCPAFVRHKDIMMSPSCLKTYGIPHMRACQRPNEFVVLNAAAYHAGFNSGFNCAEAVNFGMKEWIPVGKEAVPCRCSALKDGVRISMKLFDPKWVDPYETPSESESEDESSDYEDSSEEEEEAKPAANRGRGRAGTKPTRKAAQRRRKAQAADFSGDEESEEEESEEEEEEQAKPAKRGKGGVTAETKGKPKAKAAAPKEKGKGKGAAAKDKGGTKAKPTTAKAKAGAKAPAKRGPGRPAKVAEVKKPAAAAAKAAAKKAIAAAVAAKRGGGVQKVTAASNKAKAAAATAAAAKPGQGARAKAGDAATTKAAADAAAASTAAGRAARASKRSGAPESEDAEGRRKRARVSAADGADDAARPAVRRGRPSKAAQADDGGKATEATPTNGKGGRRVAGGEASPDPAPPAPLPPAELTPDGRHIVTAVKPRSTVAAAAMALKARGAHTPTAEAVLGSPMAIVGDAEAPGGRRAAAVAAAAATAATAAAAAAAAAVDSAEAPAAALAADTSKRFFFLVQRLARPAPTPGNVLLRWLKEGRDGVFRPVLGSVWEEPAAALLPVRSQAVCAGGGGGGGASNGSGLDVLGDGADGDNCSGGGGPTSSSNSTAGGGSGSGANAVPAHEPEAWRLVTPREQIVDVELRRD